MKLLIILVCFQVCFGAITDTNSYLEAQFLNINDEVKAAPKDDTVQEVKKLYLPTYILSREKEGYLICINILKDILILLLIALYLLLF
jgi:hypothetical protein